jgi:hypothetical protein
VRTRRAPGAMTSTLFAVLVTSGEKQTLPRLIVWRYAEDAAAKARTSYHSRESRHRVLRELTVLSPQLTRLGRAFSRCRGAKKVGSLLGSKLAGGRARPGRLNRP